MYPDTLAPGELVFFIETTTLLTGMITTIENDDVSVLFENGTEKKFHWPIAKVLLMTSREVAESRLVEVKKIYRDSSGRIPFGTRKRK
jgi:hypothetical protein